MKDTVRAMFATAGQMDDAKQRQALASHALKSESARAIHSALDLAQSEAKIVVHTDSLDTDPLLLNVNTGTIDLRTGHQHPHDRGDLITKLAPIDYDPHAKAPAWQAFLDRVLEGDQALAELLRRAVGYSLTGTTGEQVLFILHGAGANGKSTFLEILRALHGDYGQQAPPELLVDRRNIIPNDVARLPGVRCLAAAESGEGGRLNESLVKSLTGGDTVAARFMRGEWFEFTPQFTPWLATNHKPTIRGTDEGIWRRIRLIPFNVTIPPDQRDPDLPAKLRAELPGILNWALEGCLAWQADGLTNPAAVEEATAEYRAEQDTSAPSSTRRASCSRASTRPARISTTHTPPGASDPANGARCPSRRAVPRQREKEGARCILSV
jgi:putative DNA primase/helicase